jgi:hypothetical protein
MIQTSLSNQPLNFGRESLTFTFSRLNAKLNATKNGRMTSHDNSQGMRLRVMDVIKSCETHDQLESAWRYAILAGLGSDEVIKRLHNMQRLVISSI